MTAFKFCSIASGSSGNCYVIASKGCKILLDAGVSGRKITQGLNSVGICPEEIDGILVTHEHSDHTKGVGIFSRKYDIPIYANEATWHVMKNSIGKVKEYNIKIFKTGEVFLIKDIDIKSYEIPHDAIDPVGFSFINNDTQISIVTDLGYMSDTILEEIVHADFLVLEANHDIEMLKMSRYPWYLKKRILSDRGHLSNIDAGKALIDLLQKNDKGREVLLAHLSHENNFPQMAYQTIKNILEEEKIYIGQHIQLYTALREEVSDIYIVSQKERC